MPIRINLLAEAQALEEMRRRDPVKRALWIGVFLVILMLAWSSSLQLKSLIAKGQLGTVEAQLAAHTNEYSVVLQNKKELADVQQRLTALHVLATNRLLHGTLLDALQKTVVSDVEMVRMHTEVAHALNEETKPKTNGTTIIPGRPATVTERVVVTVDARDVSASPGDQVNKYKQKIADYPYFRNALGATNEVLLINLSPPQTTGRDKPFVLFTLECRYPEKTR